MGKLSRDKGKRGELEWAEQLREMGFKDAHRGQQFKGTPDSPDVASGIPGTHPEVKRVERLNLSEAMRKAEQDCGGDDATIPYIAHRRNREPWLVTLRACDLVALARRIVKTLDDPFSGEPINDSQLAALVAPLQFKG